MVVEDKIDLSRRPSSDWSGQVENEKWSLFAVETATKTPVLNYFECKVAVLEIAILNSFECKVIYIFRRH